MLILRANNGYKIYLIFNKWKRITSIYSIFCPFLLSIWRPVLGMVYDLESRIVGWLCNHSSLADELVNEKEKYKNIADEMDQAFSELSGF